MKKLKLDPKGRMLIRTVDFDFVDSKDPKNKFTVRFCHEDGKPSIITFFTYKTKNCEDFVIDNRNGRYKPCATHAQEILRTLTHKPPKTEFAKQRLKAAKPELRVVG